MATSERTSRAPKIVEAKFVAAQGISGGALPPPTFVEIAFAGRSNVGKSSLINTALERRGLVRTSSTPGCTRQINLFEVRTADGAAMLFADLPGYGFAKRSKQERNEWATLIEGYIKTRPTLAAIAILFDARRGLEEDDLALVEFAGAGRGRGLRPLEVVLVATKVDKLPRSGAKSALAKISAQTQPYLSGSRKVIGFSAIDGRGREELWAALRRVTHLDAENAGDSRTDETETNRESTP